MYICVCAMIHTYIHMYKATHYSNFQLNKFIIKCSLNTINQFNL